MAVKGGLEFSEVIEADRFPSTPDLPRSVTCPTPTDRDGKAERKPKESRDHNIPSFPRLHEDTVVTTLRQSMLNILNADIAPLQRALV